MEDQITWHDLDTSFGRMCQELSQATEEKTSPQSLKKRSKSSSRKPPLFLCLKRDGLSPDASTMRWEPGALLGEFTMHSFGECPNEENASLLSQILEDSPHPKYYLSEKACLGILKRAERRGKELPPMLKEALLTQSRSRSEAENLGGGKGILIQEERTGALSTLNNQSVFAPVASTLRSGAGAPKHEADMLGRLVCENGVRIFDARGNGDGAIACTITGDHKNRVTDYTALAVGFTQQGFGDYKPGEVASSLKRRDHKDATTLCLGLDCEHNVHYDRYGTLRAHSSGGAEEKVMSRNIVRRLTPLECERLQGYPDGWTLIGEPCEVEIKDYQIVLVPGKDCAYQTESDAFWAWEESVARDSDGEPIETFDAKKFGFIEKKVQVGSHKETRHFYCDENGRKRECSDTARYKALGNSIALPFWFWLMRRISAQYERPATLGSLFDGIGGFPLCWERCNGPGTALWASEIEEFPMAVARARFQ